MTITFADPRGRCLTPARPYDLSVDMDGRARLGLVINRIVDCDRFMRTLGEALNDLRPRLSVNYYFTGRITFAEAALMDRVAEENDAAVCAIGHCGSCTAGAVKDGVAIVERGRPAVSLVTELFWEQAGMLARSLGWPDAPRLKLPYPIWGRDEASLRAVAQSLAPNVIRSLGRPDGKPI